MDNSLRQKLETVFHEAGTPLDDKLLSECVSLCQTFVLDPETLRFKLEALNYTSSATMSKIRPITMDSLIAIKTQIQQGLTKENARKAQTKPRGITTAQIDRSKIPSHMNRNVVKPNTTSVKQEHPGEPLGLTAPGNNTISNVAFVGPPADSEARKKRAYRYMFEKISERSENLDLIIDDFADLIRAHYEIPEFGDPSATTDEEVVIVGRITHDAESAAMSKLAEGAITIESSRALSLGSRVPLVLDSTIKIRGSVKGIGGVGIYPGAIVALKGKNGGGGYFLATEVLGIPPLKPSPAAHGITDPKLHPTMPQHSASMIVACGPFTLDSDISYRPWRTLLQQIKVEKPDVLVLVGPFVDAAHPKIKAGDLDVSPTNLFRAHFVDPLKAFLTVSPGSIVLLLPGVRDLASCHSAFPQPELDGEIFNFHPRIHLLPNPARFTVNDIAFAATSVDSLFHLRKEEYFKRGIEVEPLPVGPDDLPTDTMANLCRHLLLQRSFYPIFPPPLDLSHEVNLDVSHFDGVRMVDEGDLDYAPDVLIVPSRLKHFSKAVHSTTAINPSFLSKGTYAVVSLAPRSAGTPKDRLKTEIVKVEIVKSEPVKTDPAAVLEPMALQ